MRAISIIPCRVLHVESRQPIGENTFLRPRFFGSSGSLKSMSRNSVRRSCHCVSKALEWTRIRVFTFLRAIIAAAVTVFPKAVVACKTPLLYVSNALMASVCSSRSFPVNVTDIFFPWLVSSVILYFTLLSFKNDRIASSHPRGIARYSSVISKQEMIRGTEYVESLSACLL